MKVFIDTNIYLHYKPIEQIDLCELLHAEAVTVMLDPITVGELDKHKDTNSSQKLRSRARKTLKKLLELHRSSQKIRDGVSIDYASEVSTIDMAKHQLDPSRNDARLIAVVLHYKQSDPSTETVLITGDFGAQLRCDQLGIKTVQLPEEYRLPPETDERDEQIRKLRTELQKYENARPCLRVSVAGHSETTIFTIAREDTVDESFIGDRLQSMKQEVPRLSRVPKLQVEPSLVEAMERLCDIASQLDGPISEEEYQRYSQERDVFFVTYERYLRNKVEFANRMRRAFRFSIEIANAGSAPAEDVDVWIHFPDGFQLYTEDQLPMGPTKPPPPVRPRTGLQMAHAEALSSANEMMMFGPNSFQQFRQDFTSYCPTFELKKTSSYQLTDHFDRIKHGSCVELPELIGIFDSHESAKSFHCEFELKVANLIEPVVGKLHFIIEHEVL